MSLVDYGSSSGDESGMEEEDDKENDEIPPPPPPEQVQQPDRPANPSSLPNSSSSSSSSQNRERSSVLQSSSEATPSAATGRLPSASFLLDSPTLPSDHLNASDHSSRVAASMAASALKKRESNGSISSVPHRKFPRGNLPPQRIQPDTLSGRLVPPQLRGRSNVVTEDIDKLFVRRRREEGDGR